MEQYEEEQYKDEDYCHDIRSYDEESIKKYESIIANTVEWELPSWNDIEVDMEHIIMCHSTLSGIINYGTEYYDRTL